MGAIKYKDDMNEENLRRLRLNFEYSDICKLPLMSKRLIVITNLYYGDKKRSEEFIKLQNTFCKHLLSLRKSKKLDAYVIANLSFKKNSKLKWESMLRFNNNGIIVELLKLLKK
ncbi:hypothetical protein BEWA_009990 [Theileria equi strain WA]|uniref:Uncharacterized protein n=1 Tax=Theileria equi strain WA TaxID=1537102 RepID=L0B182_THEEQ|nr:hypothetical protein BEWA_009990 [Theileria equi strain WA]AFZ81585.1 hypothetical protein BEWA_009990 [Theileria equi strain WA]|eukprot:XP_004831251.1 hypothetical protein BEWA_009990 [Theileria equi strain WA]